MDDLVKIDGRRPGVRVALVVVVILTLLTCWFAVRWQMANLLAAVTRPTDQNAAEIAKTAVAWSPSDPSTSALAAATSNLSSVENLSRAVSLAPNDYRWRIEFGRALERKGDYATAEVEFRRAIELAPSYARPRWHLGNFLLRREREVEAFDELKKAAANDFDYRNQVFSLAWEYYDKDARRLTEIAGGTDEARARLAFFLASRGKGEESLAAWQRVGDPERYAALRKEIADGLFMQRQFRVALAFAREAGSDSGAAVGKVTNASFEENLEAASASKFGWVVSEPDSKIQISPDSRIRHGGERSLRVAYRNFTRTEQTYLSQTIVVLSDAEYRLTFWVRTENLRTASPPLLEVIDAGSGMAIARPNPFPSSSSDWTQIALAFRTPRECEGITIRSGRVPCGEDCSITGTLWLDDFELAGSGS